MHPITPVRSIASSIVSTPGNLIKTDPALEPLKQSLVVISPLTPSLEAKPPHDKEPKLKLAAIEDKTQGAAPRKVAQWPQPILDLAAYKDPSKLLPVLQTLARGELSCLKIGANHLAYLNIGFVKDCQDLGFKFFLDLSLNPLDIKRLAALSYMSPSFISYAIEGFPQALVEELFHAHFEYHPEAQLVFSTQADPSLPLDNPLIERMDRLTHSYQNALHSLYTKFEEESLKAPLSSQDFNALKERSLRAPYILCKAPELPQLRQHLGPSFPLILEAEDAAETISFEIAKTPGLNLASFIVLGNSILQSADPVFELEKALGYLKNSL